MYIYTGRFERHTYYPTALEDAVPASFISLSMTNIHKHVYACNVHQSIQMKGSIPAEGQSVPKMQAAEVNIYIYIYHRVGMKV